jgi:hypothetical protein
MTNDDKKRLENLAIELLAINPSVSIRTRSLSPLGYTTASISRLIADYKQLSIEEQLFIFEKGIVNKTDLDDFTIVIKKK